MTDKKELNLDELEKISGGNIDDDYYKVDKGYGVTVWKKKDDDSDDEYYRCMEVKTGNIAYVKIEPPKKGELWTNSALNSPWD